MGSAQLLFRLVLRLVATVGDVFELEQAVAVIDVHDQELEGIGADMTGDIHPQGLGDGRGIGGSDIGDLLGHASKVVGNLVGLEGLGPRSRPFMNLRDIHGDARSNVGL